MTDPRFTNSLISIKEELERIRRVLAINTLINAGTTLDESDIDYLRRYSKR